jgi:cytochrome c-type biogenesis protein CcmE
MTSFDEPIGGGNRTKFIVGGALILAAIIFLIATSTQAGKQYYMTVEELYARGDEAVGLPASVIGAVIGDTIVIEKGTTIIRFTVAHLPADNEELEALGGLTEALKLAVNDPKAMHLDVVYDGAPPDLLQDEAQAILTGTLGEDGIFYADELLLKCPTRYDEAAPE